MLILTSDRPYFETWLRRTRRQFAISGRLSQTAAALAATEGGSLDSWRAQLKSLITSKEIPSLDLLTRIDKILAGPPKSQHPQAVQGSLF
jgi:hypothetical protein